MSIGATREAAEEYLKGDPFVSQGVTSQWYVREWANRFAGSSDTEGGVKR